MRQAGEPLLPPSDGGGGGGGGSLIVRSAGCSIASPEPLAPAHSSVLCLVVVTIGPVSVGRLLTVTTSVRVYRYCPLLQLRRPGQRGAVEHLGRGRLGVVGPDLRGGDGCHDQQRREAERAVAAPAPARQVSAGRGFELVADARQSLLEALLAHASASRPARKLPSARDTLNRAAFSEQPSCAATCS